MVNKFSQKHYKVIAKLLGKAIAEEETIEDVITDFCRMFEEDCPDRETIFCFNTLRFQKAIKATTEATLKEKREIFKVISIAIEGLKNARKQ
jgi:hypothetical protein